MSEPKSKEYLKSVPFACAGVAMFDHLLGGRSPDSALVTTTMRSGRQFFSFGVQFTAPEHHPGCVLFRDHPANTERGLVVREADILDIETQWLPPVAEGQPTPFGPAAFRSGRGE